MGCLTASARTPHRSSTFPDRPGAPGRAREQGLTRALTPRCAPSAARTRARRPRARPARSARQGARSGPPAGAASGARRGSKSTIRGMMPRLGSSRVRKRGRDIRARAIESICPSPPESVPARCPTRCWRTGKSVKTRSIISCPRFGSRSGNVQRRRFSPTVSRLKSLRCPSGTSAMPSPTRSGAWSVSSATTRACTRRADHGPPPRPVAPPRLASHNFTSADKRGSSPSRRHGLRGERFHQPFYAGKEQP